MKDVEMILQEGCKLYATYEQGKYHIRLTPPGKHEVAFLVESESFLYGVQKAIQHVRSWQETRLQNKNVQST